MVWAGREGFQIRKATKVMNDASATLNNYKKEWRKDEHLSSRDEFEWFKPIVEPAVVTIYSLEPKK